MDIHFYKYEAAGNDFLLIDNRESKIVIPQSRIPELCDRRFGIGADGIISLEKIPGYDFKMVYFNRDSSEGFCGNGCRAIVHLANKLGVIGKSAKFVAYDGLHTATILREGVVRQSLIDVSVIEPKGDDLFINTGTEHNIRFVKNLDNYPVVEEGRKIRYSDLYKPRGTNADFVEMKNGQSVAFRIYERGVEDETYSSGSGATACALAVAKKFNLPSPVRLQARGGLLEVEFKTRPDGTFHEIFLTGPVKLVFETQVAV